MAAPFLYDEAFSRNFGLLSDHELDVVKTVKIGIGGMGGCGSNHLLTLARMGFQHFAIADPDTFDLSNLNRQAGAFVSTVGQRKTDVMLRMLKDINPDATLVVFDDGVTEKNLGDFIAITDLGINAIDFFRIDLYSAFHDGYRAAGKPSIVGASPFAFGLAMTVISPQTDSFDKFMGFCPEDSKSELLRKFVARMAPSRFAASYLPPRVNEIRDPLEDTRISSSAAALQLCAAVTATEALFLATKRRPPILAPRTLEIDLHSLQLKY